MNKAVRLKRCMNNMRGSSRWHIHTVAWVGTICKPAIGECVSMCLAMAIQSACLRAIASCGTRTIRSVSTSSPAGTRPRGVARPIWAMGTSPSMCRPVRETVDTMTRLAMDHLDLGTTSAAPDATGGSSSRQSESAPGQHASPAWRGHAFLGRIRPTPRRLGPLSHRHRPPHRAQNSDPRTIASNPPADNPCIARLSGFSLHSLPSNEGVGDRHPAPNP